MKHAKHAVRRNSFKTLGRLAGLVAVVGISGLIGVSLLLQSNAAPTTQAGLAAAIENVTSASIYRYTSYDNRIQGMDTAKVITNPGGGYLAIYHSGNNINLATSTDLKNWTWKVKLDNGTQPTITATSDGGFLVAHEANNGGGFVRVIHYPSLTALYTAKADRVFSAPRTLSSCNEGTPNFNSVSLNPAINSSVIKIGFHYHSGCNVDREAIGTLTNFTGWSTVTAPSLDNAVAAAARAAGQNIGGNIGDRDVITYGGTTYALIEGQLTKNDFGSWRTFLYNYSTGQAQLLNIKTHKGSKSFANPTITAVKGPDGSAGLAIGMYIHAPAAGEGGGELIYYVRLADTPANPAPAPAPAAKPSPSPTPPASPTKPSTSGSKPTNGTSSMTGGATSGASNENNASSTSATGNAASSTIPTESSTDVSNVDLASLIPKDGDKDADSAPVKKKKSLAAAGLIAFAVIAAIGGTIYIIKKHRAHQAEQQLNDSLTVYDDEATPQAEEQIADPYQVEQVDQIEGQEPYAETTERTAETAATAPRQTIEEGTEEVAVENGEQAAEEIYEEQLEEPTEQAEEYTEEPVTYQPEETTTETPAETAPEAPEALETTEQVQPDDGQLAVQQDDQGVQEDGQTDDQSSDQDNEGGGNSTTNRTA